MTQNTFFNILAVLGILYGIWRAIRYIAAIAFFVENRHRGAYLKTSLHVFSVLGAITFFAGIYKLFVQ